MTLTHSELRQYPKNRDKSPFITDSQHKIFATQACASEKLVHSPYCDKTQGASNEGGFPVNRCLTRRMPPAIDRA
jgi:hypothetical protein